jgi:hypothetical protein
METFIVDMHRLVKLCEQVSMSSVGIGRSFSNLICLSNGIITFEIVYWLSGEFLIALEGSITLLGSHGVLSHITICRVFCNSSEDIDLVSTAAVVPYILRGIVIPEI